MIGPTRDEMWLMEKCPKFQLLMVFTTHIHIHQGQHVRVVWVQAAADSYKCNLMLATTDRFSMLRLGLGGNSSVLNIPSYNRFSVYHYANAIKHESTKRYHEMRSCKKKRHQVMKELSVSGSIPGEYESVNLVGTLILFSTVSTTSTALTSLLSSPTPISHPLNGQPSFFSPLFYRSDHVICLQGISWK